jgi:hypothetical protein
MSGNYYYLQESKKERLLAIIILESNRMENPRKEANIPARIFGK